MIYFRADGNSSIGLGHLYRSAALAAMLRDTDTCIFVSNGLPDSLQPMILAASTGIIDLSGDPGDEADRFASLLREGDTVVLDGYHFDTAYQLRLRQVPGVKVVCIDDIPGDKIAADVLINHAGGVAKEEYPAAFYTECYLGPKYALLRPEFLQTGAALHPEREENLLICLGGSDPENHTLEVLQSADLNGFRQVHILTGAGYRHHASLEDHFRNSSASLQLHSNLPAADVLALMQHCGYAVLSPSSVSYEYMSTGGALFLYQIADNQARLRAFCLTEGLAEDFSSFRRLPQAEYTEMIRRQHTLFDGRSPERFRKMFASLRTAGAIHRRRAAATDLQLTFNWANDPVSRQMSFNPAPIPLENHSAWFLARIDSPHCYYYILEQDGLPVAQIRYDEKPEGWVLSYTIDAAWRGKGLGAKVLAIGAEGLQQDLRKPATVVGYVQKSNTASCLSFERLPYTREETTEYADSWRYVIALPFP